MCIQFRVFENFFTLNIQSRYSKRYYTLYSNQIGMDRKANNEDDDKRTKMLKILCRAVVVKIKTLDSKIYQFFVKRNFKRTKNQIHAGNIQKFNEKMAKEEENIILMKKKPNSYNKNNNVNIFFTGLRYNSVVVDDTRVFVFKCSSSTITR